MLPVCRPWFRSRTVTPSLTLIDEPHVDDLLRSNIWHLAGTDRDLIVDTGLGVASLQAELSHLFDHDPAVVITHGHLDHLGGAYEFDVVAAHTADQIVLPHQGTLDGMVLARLLGLKNYDEPIPDMVITARPTDDFEPAQYKLRPPKTVNWISEGDIIELGNRSFTALHLPGHSWGSIALHDPVDGILFSGDVVCDGQLLDTLHGSDRQAYSASMARLRSLPIRVVYPGHGDPFESERLHHIIDHYLAGRTDDAQYGPIAHVDPGWLSERSPHARATRRLRSSSPLLA